MALIENPSVQFQELKKPDPLRFEVAKSTQEAIEIHRISPSGIFQIGQDKYSMTLEMNDINYSNKSYPEQVIFYDSWCGIFNMFGNPFKISLCNKKRSLKTMNEKIFYQKKGDLYDDARECYNDVMRNKILNDRQGIEQKKYLTIIQNKNGGVQEAEKAMASLEAGYTKEYAEFGCRLIPLSGNERLTLLRGYYRGDEKTCSIERCIESGTDWRNEVCADNIDWTNLHPSYIKLENRYVRTLYIDPHSYGDTLEDKFFRELASVSAESIVTLDVVPIPKSVTQRLLESRYMGIEEKIRKQQDKRNKQKAFSSDISYKVRREKEEIEEMLDAVRQNGQKQFWVGVSIAVFAETLDELEQYTSTVEQICSGNNCKLKTYMNMQREGLNTVLPIGVRNSSNMRAMFTQSAAGFIPFHVMELFDDSFQPFFYGVNKDSKNPIVFSRKSLDNPNGFIFGISGSGKTMTCSKFEMGSVFLTTEEDIIAIDPQLEYRDVCSSFNGSYINFGPETQEYMNMFHCDLDKLRTTPDVIIKEKITLTHSVIEQLLDGDMPPGIKTIVERCVRSMYERILSLPFEKQYVPIMTDFYEEAKKQLEIERQLENKVSINAAEQLALAAERFMSGPMEIFNHQSNIDMNNRVVCFGIKNLDESQWAMAMCIILSFISIKVHENFAKGVTTWIYIDECHYMTAKKISKEYLVTAWKTFRKFGAILTGLTQNAIDLLKDPDTTTIVSNSLYTVFMKQSENDIESILKSFNNISEAQVKFLTGAAKGTGVLRYGDIVMAMDARIDKNNPIYDVFNTNPYEKQQRNK